MKLDLEHLRAEIFSYPQIEEILEKEPRQRKKILSYIDEIRGNFNPTLVRASISILDKTFAKLYDSFRLDTASGFSLEQAMSHCHVIFVPNHQSHADYIALTYMMYKRFQIPIYIAGGINLNIFPIGRFFRNTGAFFMRRSFRDDPVYKYTFEAYLYYLLGEDGGIEFFFEGGRSRTGKLMPPRFGLFQMILEAHRKRKEKGKTHKPLMFIPVTIAHEIVPEVGAHAKELGGDKKIKEKTSQLFKIFSLFRKRLGSIHVTLQQGIVVDSYGDLKLKTQELAFDCFRSVGKGMPVTPTSLLAMVLLGDPSGGLNWTSIKERAFEILDYCHYMGVPVAESLKKGNSPRSLREAMEIFLNNKQVQEVYQKHFKERYYLIKRGARVELVYFKNTILHHFLLPYFINTSWSKILSGQIKNASELEGYLKRKRLELKFEFYLPSFKEILEEGAKVISFALGHPLVSIHDIFKFTPQEFFLIAIRVRAFSTAFTSLLECYYLSLVTLEAFAVSKVFTEEEFLKQAKKCHEIEILHGNVISFQESFLSPILKTALKFLENEGVLEAIGKRQYRIRDEKKAEEMARSWRTDLRDEVKMNLKFSEPREIIV